MVLVVLVAMAVVINFNIAMAASSHYSTNVVQRFSDGSVVPGSWSRLVTNNAGASMTLHTTELTPGHAVTIWWVIFNKPENCEHGEGPYRCGAGDLPPFGGDDSAMTSVVYAAGHVMGQGNDNWAGHLSTGDTKGALWGPGLVDPLSADVHLIVHDHGQALPEMTDDMIHNFGFCNPDCVDLQFSVHEQ